MSEQWLTVEEAAARVGRNRSTIYRWIADGDLSLHMQLIHVEQLVRVEQERRRARSSRKKTGSAPTVAALASEIGVDMGALARALHGLVGGSQ